LAYSVAGAQSFRRFLRQGLDIAANGAAQGQGIIEPRVIPATVQGRSQTEESLAGFELRLRALRDASRRSAQREQDTSGCE
jgi:hypothetical protein